MRHIFIINPAAGKHDISETIRTDIEKICAERNIDPLIFISEYAGYERDMTRKMCTLFSNEPIRFYSIGGSGTLYQIISGITNFETTDFLLKTSLHNTIANTIKKIAYANNPGYANFMYCAT